MSRQKEPRTLEEIRAAREQAEEDVRIAQQKVKIKEREIQDFLRRTRTHRLCVRGAMLESFMVRPEEVENEAVKAVLETAFAQKAVKVKMEELKFPSKARDPE